MIGLNIIKNAVISHGLASVAAGQTQQTTEIVDTSGFDSVLFALLLGDVSDGCSLELRLQQGDESDMSDAEDTDLCCSFDAGAADADDKIMIIEVNQPVKRYVRGKISRADANGEIDGVLTIKFGSSEAPVTEDSGVISSTLSLAPNST